MIGVLNEDVTFNGPLQDGAGASSFPDIGPSGMQLARIDGMMRGVKLTDGVLKRSQACRHLGRRSYCLA
jgi:hypothetical protein